MEETDDPTSVLPPDQVAAIRDQTPSHDQALDGFFTDAPPAEGPPPTVDWAPAQLPGSTSVLRHAYLKRLPQAATACPGNASSS